MPNTPTGHSIYPYYYKGGEIYSCDFSGLKKNSTELIKRLEEEKKFILSKNGRMRIWLNLCDTDLTKDVQRHLTSWADTLQNSIYKLALVGLPSRSILGISFQGGFHLHNPQIPIKEFIDPEEAKTWLVNE